MKIYILDEKGVDLCNSGLPEKEDEQCLPEAVIIVYNPKGGGTGK